MDTSKEYITMSDKSGLEECCSFVLPSFLGKVKYIGDNVFVELDLGSTTWRTVRLFRQSQIQEMMSVNNAIDFRDAVDEMFYERDGGLFDIWGKWFWPNEHEDTPFHSPEQLWLAFYMYENHQKIWDGKKWVKSVKE